MEEDRISDLPEFILLEILSLIQQKSSVQTCVLSKRWRYLWKSLPNLDFNQAKFRIDCANCTWSSLEECQKCSLECFTDFVYQILSTRDNSDVCKFSLFIEDCIADPTLVEGCINYAVRHNVCKLHISACCMKPFSIPSCFFACNSLRVLKLKNFVRAMYVPKSFSLPALIELHLTGFELKDEDDGYSFSGEPFSGFTNLECLTLENCFLSNSIVYAPKLRILEILFRAPHPQFSYEDKNISVCTPRLTSFKFDGHVSLECSIEELPCLEKVYINQWTVFEEPYTDEVKQRMPLNLIKMLGQFRNAKSLVLSLNTIEVLAMDPSAIKSHPSPFSNLKLMKVIDTEMYKFYDMPLNVDDVKAFLTKGSTCTETPQVEFPEVWKVDSYKRRNWNSG